jgi:hypothetical protein
MPSKQETGTSSLPQEPPQKPPQVAFLKASSPFQAIPSPVPLTSPKSPYQTANKEKKNKK